MLGVGLFKMLPLFLLGAAVYVVGVPLYNPTVPLLLIQCVPPSSRGAVLGFDSAINTIGRILGPVALGILYGSYGPEACYTAAALVVGFAAVLAASRRAIVMLGG